MLLSLENRPLIIYSIIYEKIPEEYQSCMTGMKLNLKQTLEIAETVADPKIKLQARAIANDCYKYIMDLTTNGVIVNDALRFIQSKVENLNTIQKLDEKIEAIEEEEGTTTNDIF
jgi:hypothetical protein